MSNFVQMSSPVVVYLETEHGTNYSLNYEKKIILVLLLGCILAIFTMLALAQDEGDELLPPVSSSENSNSEDSGVKAIYKDGKYLGSYLKGEGSNVSSFIPKDGSDLISCVHTDAVVSCN